MYYICLSSYLSFCLVVFTYVHLPIRGNFPVCCLSMICIFCPSVSRVSLVVKQKQTKAFWNIFSSLRDISLFSSVGLSLPSPLFFLVLRFRTRHFVLFCFVWMLAWWRAFVMIPTEGYCCYSTTQLEILTVVTRAILLHIFGMLPPHLALASCP